jgi:hypothetical protein
MERIVADGIQVLIAGLQPPQGATPRLGRQPLRFMRRVLDTDHGKLYRQRNNSSSHGQIPNVDGGGQVDSVLAHGALLTSSTRDVSNGAQAPDADAPPGTLVEPGTDSGRPQPDSTHRVSASPRVGASIAAAARSQRWVSSLASAA